MAAVEPVPRPFVGHDDLDEEANDPNDVLIPPETTVRYDRNEEFILTQMRMPRNIRQDAASLEEMRDHANVKWVHCPDALLPLIPHVEGMDLSHPTQQHVGHLAPTGLAATSSHARRRHSCFSITRICSPGSHWAGGTLPSNTGTT